MKLASWFKSTPAAAVLVGKGPAARAARTAARKEAAAAKKAENLAPKIEATLPGLKAKVDAAALALAQAREALSAATSRMVAEAETWSRRQEKAEAAVRETANPALLEFWRALMLNRDRVRRGVLRVPSGVAPELAGTENYHAALLDALRWAAERIAADHDDERTEAEVADRMLALRLDLVLEDAEGRMAGASR
ncbi:MAG: hypothetical protein L6R43_08810 [Planctomycetes bacterium]|nr:hypothetical protein [Planctomycetota bacterium]